jgi:transposase
MEPTVQPVLRSPVKRRYRTREEKRRIVEETLSSEASVSMMARRHGVNTNQLFHWRKLYEAGLLGTSTDRNGHRWSAPVAGDDD